MRNLRLGLSALALVLFVPSVAAAQSAAGSAKPSSCPPGSWFCAESPQQQVTPEGQPLEELPNPDAAPTPAKRPPPVTYQPAPGQPPAVTYERSPPPPPPAGYGPPGYGPPGYGAPGYAPPGYGPPGPLPYGYERRPPPPPLSRPREWGLNLHLQAAMIGRGDSGDAGLGGAGLGLRFKPSPYFGIESDLDFLGGHGYAGDDRNETGLSFNALLFVNPRSRAQFYLLAGFGWSWAHSVCDISTGAACPGGQSVDANYTYFGGQGGGGLEVRLTPTFAFNVDLRGFVRGRTDELAQRTPEFGPDRSGRTTNTAGGALLTGGMTLYF
jgi:hypothetical protein